MNLDQFNEFFNQLKSHSPNIKIAYKNESLFMKFLGTLLFFNKGFMNSFVTTIGDTIYFPNREFIENNTSESIVMLAHEYQHIVDSKKYSKFLFSAFYLFPQICFIPMFAMGFAHWLFFIYAFLFLLPLPAMYRTYFEVRAYAASLFVIDILFTLKNKTDYYERIEFLNRHSSFYEKLFTGMAYYMMCPFKSDVNYYFNEIQNYIINGDFYKNNKNKLYFIDSITFKQIHNCLLNSIKIKHLDA